ncbi:conserved hypothetical protein [Hyphomicrobiales bacterium]|nr:conserved hypothetical protein [Hyphomicrobiales bacterium]CAH1701269.1 conserved hypothetical protein [Hyphomicrobiales bacterium]CAI0345232.1 conserved hypothetical protein [Hyphomicrobiales bacterium]
MPKRQNPFADIPPITDFESCQRARPLILQRLADLFGVWEACANKTCIRARSCRRKDAACLFAFMQAVPDKDRRELRYALDNRAAGLEPDEAIARAEARIADEITRHGE